MENVLDIYKRHYDEKNPWLCFDESCKQLVKETRDPIPAEPGKLKRYDYQYERNGVANLFMFFEPLTGWRHLNTAVGEAARFWRLLNPLGLNMAEIELSVLNRQCLNRRQT